MAKIKPGSEPGKALYELAVFGIFSHKLAHSAPLLISSGDVDLMPKIIALVVPDNYAIKWNTTHLILFIPCHVAANLAGGLRCCQAQAAIAWAIERASSA